MIGFGAILKDYLEYYKISQTDFASRLGITQKHLNNIINGSANFSEELMVSISLITDIDVNMIAYIEKRKEVYNYLNREIGDEKAIKAFLKPYCINECDKRRWFRLRDKTSLTQCALDILEYLNISNFDLINNYLGNKVLFKKASDADLIKIYLWVRHCDILVAGKEVPDYDSSKLNDLINELKKESLKEFNEERIINILNKYGIYCVIEEALPGTKIRGCMMVKGTTPTIYLTKTFKEKSSFYFALFHELAHVKRDYNKAKSKIVVAADSIEDDADLIALNWMINPKVWNSIKINIDNVEKICNKEKIPVSFATSRLAKEKIISYKSELYNKYREKIN